MQKREDIDFKSFEQKLLAERDILLSELATLGVRNPSNPQDWVPEAPEMDTSPADRNESADKIEGFEENSAILKELETRLQNVKAALERIERGTYGICRVSGEPIEIERLEANPAANTCIAHREAPE